ncbi:Hypothetical protein CINCED_3A004906 [Cinara cedri]|uniref:Uncharacterized protein n=1 Tax=Cinara cedri TaxID=506608 RepID=A0A5E4M512_9HEMI|nr:Hypothetical protein CINCED_3A004906 [Cinara cedri]
MSMSHIDESSVTTLVVQLFEIIHLLHLLQLWNVHAATIEDEAQTNNSAEGWNHRFSKFVGQNHSTVWTMVSKIRLEITADETKLAQESLGVVQKKRYINEDIKKKIKTVMFKL